MSLFSHPADSGGRKRPEIRELLFLILLPAMLVPLFLMSAVSYRIVSRVLIERIHDDNDALAHSIQREISGFLEMASVITRTVAQEAAFFQDRGNDVSGMLSSILATVPFFERLTVYDARGDVIATAPRDRDLIGSNFGESSFFRSIKAGKSGYWTDSFISSSSLKPTIRYSVPLADGVLAINLNLGILSTIVREVQDPGNRKILITDRDGTVMAFENEEYVTQRRKMYPETGRDRELIRFEGESFISRTLLIEKTDWPLFILSPETLVTGPLRRIALSILLITLIFAGALLVVIHFLSRRLSDPIKRLVLQARDITDGNYVVSGHAGFREAQTLLDAMGDMASTIEIREEALQKSEQKYRLLVENAATIIIRWDSSFRITFYNEYAAKFFHLSEDSSLIGTPLSELTLSDDQITAGDIWNNPEAFTTYRNKNKRLDGSVVWIQWTTKPLYNGEGVLTEILSVGSDISELQKTISEREALLSEVHHRVKNNLQLIISLLRLKHSQMKDTKESSSFRESIAHIYSISLVHEQLYQSDSFSRIVLQEYVEQIISHLDDLFPSSGKPVAFDTQIREIVLPIDKAIPCGLVLMELISNSLRHAFSGPGSGPVSGTDSISIHGRVVNEKIEISLRDNGRGFSPELFSGAQTLGFQMIRLLVRQIGGEISLSSEEGKGAVFQLLF
jgi:PAS domain S-box-containing protein